MKKTLAILLAMVMVLSLAACGKTEPSDTPAPSEAPAAAETPAPSEAPAAEEPAPTPAPVASGDETGFTADIAWPDNLLGEVQAKITIFPTSETWVINYETAYGPAELTGSYSGRDGSMVLINDNGLTNFGLNFEDVKASAQPTIVETMAANSITPVFFEDKVTWNDALLGDIDATLKVFPVNEEWEINYETPYGAPVLSGWYVTDTAHMEMTEDSGTTNYGLKFEDVAASAAPIIQGFVADNGLTKTAREYNPNFCVHRFVDAVCDRCGAADTSSCEHSMFMNGVCADCGAPCPHVNHDPVDLYCEDCGQQGYHTFEDGVCSCGKTTIFSMEKVDGSYLTPAAQVGVEEVISYETYSYALEKVTGSTERIPMVKEAYVYLPAGYDPNTAYDIMYLMHGGGGDNHEWLNFSIGNVLEHCIEEGICKPMILVTPTFYSNVEGYEEHEEAATWVWTEEFAQELVNDLMPAVEAKYSTYAHGDVSAESLKASRQHRAFAGLSMGSVTTWMSVLNCNTDYFGYVGNYSGGPTFEVPKALTMTEEIAENLRSDLTASGNKIYYWFNGDGVLDMAHDPHIEAYNHMIEIAPDLFQDGVNASYIEYIWGDHDFMAWTADFYNSLKVFFQLDEPGENPELEALAAEGNLR